MNRCWDLTEKSLRYLGESFEQLESLQNINLNFHSCKNIPGGTWRAIKGDFQLVELTKIRIRQFSKRELFVK